jgi:hypothetical protein
MTIVVTIMDTIVALANTGHLEIDELSTNEEVRKWWCAVADDSAVGPTAPGSQDDVQMLRTTRNVIRGLGLRHNGIDVAVDVSALEALPLKFEVADRPGITVGGPTNLPRYVIGRALEELMVSSGSPGWGRLKACPGPDCGWVFIDGSRNASRRWCQMSECGNRAKAGAFRARQRDAASRQREAV